MRIVAVILVAIIGQIAVAQSERAKHQGFVLPPEIVLPVIASQPDCPLKFENVRLLVYLDPPGSVADSFRLRNAGTKSIRDYTIASSSSYGAFWTESRDKESLGSGIQPGAIIPMRGEDVEMIPLTDDLRDKFKLSKREMGGVQVFMVVRVEFTDGSVYTDEKAAKALESYFEKVAQRER